MGNLRLTNDEYVWLKQKVPFFKPLYLEFLKNYSFDPKQVEVSLDKDSNLDIQVTGPWYSTILWEVPLLSMISELYFRYIDQNWEFSVTDITRKANDKFSELSKNGCKFAEFGTRRRRSFEVQNIVIQGIASREYLETIHGRKGIFSGTSNVYFAKEFDIPIIGTMAHEWIQGMQSLESLNHCNYRAMDNWIRVYNCDLGIVLTDTITTDMFLNNFNKRFAMLFSGVRQDSGNPYEFVDRIVKAYKCHNIDPMSKFIIFSDGLNVEECISLKKYCDGKIKCSFGIGTNLTNDFEDSPALNMVLKLWDVNGIPVVKLSDVPGKENGDASAIKIMKQVVSQCCGEK
jgi:nicotinate phosphoribosyltransferase